MDKQLSAFLTRNASQEYAWLADAWNEKHPDKKKSVDSIRKAYRSLGLPAKREGKQTRVPITAEQQVALDLEKLKLTREERGTDKKYSVAMREIERLRGVIEAFSAMRERVTPYVIRPSKGEGGEAVAVAVASDWHVEENVKPESVNFSNAYTLAIARKRADTFFRHTLQLVEKEQHAVRIDTLCLALLGDFFSGNIHDELMESCEVPPIEAALEAQKMLASGIQFLLDNSSLKLIVPCAVGNHSRITHKVHVSTEQGNSLEWMVYNNLALHFKDEKRVTFLLSKSYHNYVQIFDHMVRFHHGHAMNYGGGIGGIMVPVLKAIARFNIFCKAYLDVFGHFHSFLDGGSFICNGSLIGDTPYGKRLGFTGRPMQAFFLIDKKRGKTVVCPVLVE